MAVAGSTVASLQFAFAAIPTPQGIVNKVLGSPAPALHSPHPLRDPSASQNPPTSGSLRMDDRYGVVVISSDSPSPPSPPTPQPLVLPFELDDSDINLDRLFQL
jgi:hypothetical protein